MAPKKSTVVKKEEKKKDEEKKKPSSIYQYFERKKGLASSTPIVKPPPTPNLPSAKSGSSSTPHQTPPDAKPARRVSSMPFFDAFRTSNASASPKTATLRKSSSYMLGRHPKPAVTHPSTPLLTVTDTDPSASPYSPPPPSSSHTVSSAKARRMVTPPPSSTPRHLPPTPNSVRIAKHTRTHSPAWSDASSDSPIPISPPLHPTNPNRRSLSPSFDLHDYDPVLRARSPLSTRPTSQVMRPISMVISEGISEGQLSQQALSDLSDEMMGLGLGYQVQGQEEDQFMANINEGKLESGRDEAESENGDANDGEEYEEFEYEEWDDSNFKSMEQMGAEAEEEKAVRMHQREWLGEIEADRVEKKAGKMKASGDVFVARAISLENADREDEDMVGGGRSREMKRGERVASRYWKDDGGIGGSVEGEWPEGLDDFGMWVDGSSGGIGSGFGLSASGSGGGGSGMSAQDKEVIPGYGQAEGSSRGGAMPVDKIKEEVSEEQELLVDISELITPVAKPDTFFADVFAKAKAHLLIHVPLYRQIISASVVKASKFSHDEAESWWAEGDGIKISSDEVEQREEKVAADLAAAEAVYLDAGKRFPGCAMSTGVPKAFAHLRMAWATGRKGRLLAHIMLCWELHTPRMLRQAGLSPDNPYLFARDVIVPRQPNVDHSTGKFPSFYPDELRHANSFYRGKNAPGEGDVECLVEAMRPGLFEDRLFVQDVDSIRLTISLGQYPLMAAKYALKDLPTSQIIHATLSIPLPSIPELSNFPTHHSFPMDLILNSSGQLRQVHIYGPHPSVSSYHHGDKSLTDFASAISLDWLVCSFSRLTGGTPDESAHGQFASGMVPTGPGVQVGSGHPGLLHWKGQLQKNDRERGLVGAGSEEFEVDAESLPIPFQQYLDGVGIDFRGLEEGSTIVNGERKSWLSRVAGLMISRAILVKSTPEERSARAVQSAITAGLDPVAKAASYKKAVQTNKANVLKYGHSAQEASRLEGLKVLGAGSLNTWRFNKPEEAAKHQFQSGPRSHPQLDFEQTRLWRGKQLVEIIMYRDGARLLIHDLHLPATTPFGVVPSPGRGQVMSAAHVDGLVTSISGAGHKQDGSLEIWYCHTNKLYYLRITKRIRNNVIDLGHTKRCCLFTDCTSSFDTRGARKEATFSALCRPTNAFKGINCSNPDGSGMIRAVGNRDAAVTVGLERVVSTSTGSAPEELDRTESGAGSGIVNFAGAALSQWQSLSLAEKKKLRSKK